MAKTENSYAVWLHDQKVGVLHVVERHSRFVLDSAYTRDAQRAVLGLTFEQDLSAHHRANVRLPPWFSNLLPEGRLREWIAHARNVPETREADLLAEVGHDLPGAVRVLEDHDQSPPPTPRREVVKDGAASTPETAWRFSLAGVAMKFSMREAGDRFAAPAVGEGGDWIVKLPDPLHAQVPLNEFSMMTLAHLAGLEVPEIRFVHRDQLGSVPGDLWPPGEEWAYAVRRFDRTEGRERVHMEDLAQVRGFYPEEKYRGSFETLAALIYRRRDTVSLIEFAKRLAFNILIGNGDAHLKNWSLLYQDPRVPRLSPAYDLVATAIYRPKSAPENLGLSFGGSRRFDAVRLSTFSRLQAKLNATNISLADEVNAFVTHVQRQWRGIADLLKDHPFLLQGIEKGLAARAAFLLRR